jgi:hypothetical protein
MPFAFNGFGTRYYGSRDKGPDGSYITTEWVAALFVPLIPLVSYRVLPVETGRNFVFYYSQDYLRKPIPMCWKQVRNVYLAVSPILIVVLYLFWAYN